MDSFFLYRLPNETSFHGGKGTISKGLAPGFVISSFYNDPKATFTIKKTENFSIDSLRLIEDTDFFSDHRENIFSYNEESTSELHYISDIERIISSLKDGEKTVYCRIITGTKRIKLADSFLKLAEKYENAMVFCFHSPLTGTWLGATPESLLISKSGRLSTMALAGTKWSEEENLDWDDKNLKEQWMVAQYIYNVLSRHKFHPTSDLTPQTKTVGKLKHLFTPFTASLPSNYTNENLLSFLYDLSPTPALCGLPKWKGYDLIKKTEKFSRGFYGGFLGPFQSLEDFSLFVILRSIVITPRGWRMYSGGGITIDSDPKKEWEETSRKGDSIIKSLIFEE